MVTRLGYDSFVLPFSNHGSNVLCPFSLSGRKRWLRENEKRGFQGQLSLKTFPNRTKRASSTASTSTEAKTAAFARTRHMKGSSNTSDLAAMFPRAYGRQIQVFLFNRGAVAQLVERPSKVPVWCNPTVGSNHERDMSSLAFFDHAVA